MEQHIITDWEKEFDKYRYKKWNQYWLDDVPETEILAFIESLLQAQQQTFRETVREVLARSQWVDSEGTADIMDDIDAALSHLPQSQ